MECIRPHNAWLALSLFIATTFIHAEPFDPAHQPPGYSAPVVLGDTALRNGAMLFQPWFDADTWRGDLLAYALDASTGMPTALRWSAAQSLATRGWTDRLIVTRRNDTGQAVALRQLSDLSSSQQDLLGDQATLDYLRGDPSLEGTRFRARIHRDNKGNVKRDGLGPVIHANPIFAGDATARLYVGANDGMLHVFSVDDGHEIFAYVPSMIYPRLVELANNSEHSSPPYSVDGGLTTGTVRFHDGTIHTLLLGALGAGGQGVFALDISNPRVQNEADALHSLLWEFSDHDEAGLGYSYATPQLVQIDGRWVVLLGNGYSNTIDDGHVGSGSAQLLIIDAESGNLIRRLDTFTGSTAEPNGLSTPRAIDSNADGYIDFVYAGDLSGQLWRFDLRGASNTWHISCNGAALFTARDPLNNPQAISTAPAIVAHPQLGVRVLFGTGRILSDSDLDAVDGAQVQSLYGIWDRLDDTCPAPTTNLRQTLSEDRYSNGQRVRLGSHNTLTSDYDLWQIDLPAGERVVTDPQLNSDRLVVTTTQPLITGGETWLLELDPQTGGAPGQIVFDMNGDGALNAQDSIAGSAATATEKITANITGFFYGTGAGSTAAFANLNASRRITYINRNIIDSLTSADCTNNCADTSLLDVSTAPLDDTDSTDATVSDDAEWLTTAMPLCGEQGCVAEARSNLGRVTWKELLAE